MKHKFLDFDAADICMASAKEVESAGWEPTIGQVPEGFASGPTIYLCHYEAQYLFLVRLVMGGIEKILETCTAKGVSFQDACDTLGSMMDDLGARNAKLDQRTRTLLSITAARYLADTKTYNLGREQGIEEYVVIRQFDAGNREGILRPAACSSKGLMSPEELAEFVIHVMRSDRQRHPNRFRKGQPIRFNPKSLD